MLALLALGLGCVVSDDHHHGPPPNEAPAIGWAESGCYWDEYNGDVIWWFQAEAWDDQYVSAMFADVYDAQGHFIDTFELYPGETGDPDVWFSDWLERSTPLDCWYGGYIVDFTAYDANDAASVVSVVPYTD